jgi:hypothetical protein
MKYEIVIGETLAVKDKVNEMLNDGWELFGTPFRVKENFKIDGSAKIYICNIAQAMIHSGLSLRRGTAITDKAKQLKKSGAHDERYRTADELLRGAAAEFSKKRRTK